MCKCSCFSVSFLMFAPLPFAMALLYTDALIKWPCFFYTSHSLRRSTPGVTGLTGLMLSVFFLLTHTHRALGDQTCLQCICATAKPIRYRVTGPPGSHWVLLERCFGSVNPVKTISVPPAGQAGPLLCCN